MNYTEINIGNDTYKLRLNTRGLVALEKSLGCNPIQIIMEAETKLPKLGDMAIILQSMLAPLQHGITIDKTFEIIDRYLDDGNSMFDLLPVFVDVFQESGFIGTEKEAEEVSDPN